jgi:hexosaminidase
VYWEEILEHTHVPKGTVIQAWNSNKSMGTALAAGHRVVSEHMAAGHAYIVVDLFIHPPMHPSMHPSNYLRTHDPSTQSPTHPFPQTNSYKWYLNHGCNNYGDGLWRDFYSNDPFNLVPTTTPPEQLALIVGGETTMWSECVNSVIFDGIVWPRAAAAAEQLWSPAEFTKSADLFLVGQRLAEHRCRLVARGIRAGPLFDDDGPRHFNGGCV